MALCAILRQDVLGWARSTKPEFNFKDTGY